MFSVLRSQKSSANLLISHKHAVLRLRAVLLLLLTSIPIGAAADSIVLRNNQWTQISFPVGDSTTTTAAQLIGDEFTAFTYSTDWILFEYDGALNAYSMADLNTPVTPGYGYWIIQVTGNDMTISAPEPQITNPTSTPLVGCSVSTCIKVSLDSSANSENWNMRGNPYKNTLMDRLRIIAPNSTVCDTGCTFDELEQLGIGDDKVFVYNNQSGIYDELNTNAPLNSWQGFWYRLQDASFSVGAEMLFPIAETDFSALDPDADGLESDVDNCPAVGNASQSDDDNDGIGNVCDNFTGFGTLVSGPGDSVALNFLTETFVQDREQRPTTTSGAYADGLSIVINPQSTITELNTLLSANGLTIAGSVSSEPLIDVFSNIVHTDETLDQLILELESSPSVISAFDDIPEEPEWTPKSAANLMDRFEQHTSTRTPAMWNVRNLVATTSSNVNLIVFDSFDGQGGKTVIRDVALQGLPKHTFKNPVQTRIGEQHGFAVAGVAAGSHDNANGVVGMHPVPEKLKLILIGRHNNRGRLKRIKYQSYLIRASLRDASARVVFNTSLGIKLKTNHPSLPKYERVVGAIAWRNAFKNVDSSRWIHVFSAGNQHDPADPLSLDSDPRWNSFWAASASFSDLCAELTLGSQDRKNCTDTYPTQPPEINNAIMVSAGTKAGDFRQRGERITKAGTSDFGYVTAVGEQVVMLEAIANSPAIEQPYTASGSSFAAPAVAGLAATIWSIDDDLSSMEVIDAIENGITSVPSTKKNTRFIDALNTILSLDTAPLNSITARVRLALLDVASTDDPFAPPPINSLVDTLANPDGKFDIADLRQLIAKYIEFDGSVTRDDSRFDLNGDGFTGDFRQGGQEFDLNGDGLIQSITASIEGIAVDFNEANATDLDLLIYYAYSDIYELSGTNAIEIERSEFFRSVVMAQALLVKNIVLDSFSIRVLEQSSASPPWLFPTTTGSDIYYDVAMPQGIPDISVFSPPFRGAFCAERGRPSWGARILAGSTMYGVRNIRNHPAPDFNNRAPCSAFFAVSADLDAVWFNLAHRKVQGAIDWEYQMRYELNTTSLTSNLQVGLVPNSGNFNMADDYLNADVRLKAVFTAP